MLFEYVEVDSYVNVGGLKIYCVKADPNTPVRCELCAFEGTERCNRITCDHSQRADRGDVIFVLKLSKL